MSIHMDAYILYTHTRTRIWLRQMTLSRDHIGFQPEAPFRPHDQVPGPRSKTFIPLTAPLTVAASTT